MRQSDHHALLRSSLEAQCRRVEALLESVDAADLVRVPPNRGWSAAQLFEHLLISADSYLDRIAPIVEAVAVPGARPVTRPWKPTIMGGMLVKVLQGPRRLPAPRIYRPGPRPRDGVMAAFLERHRRTGELLDRAAGICWTEHRFVSPVSRLVRMNLGDAFAVLVVHAERHLGQVEGRLDGAYS